MCERKAVGKGIQLKIKKEVVRSTKGEKRK